MCTLKDFKNAKKNENYFFCTQNIVCFLKPVKSTCNDTLLLSITNTDVLKVTGHHQLCNCSFTILAGGVPRFNESKYFIISHVVRCYTCMKNTEHLVL